MSHKRPGKNYYGQDPSFSVNALGPRKVRSLAAQLRKEWEAKQKADQAPPPSSDDDTPPPQPLLPAPLPEPTPAEVPPRQSFYIGRAVTSNALLAAMDHWQTFAAEAGLDFRPVRHPLGIRYLGSRALYELERFSLARGTDEEFTAPNPGVHAVAELNEILESAREGELFDTVFSHREILAYGVGIKTQSFARVGHPADLAVGVRLGAGQGDRRSQGRIRNNVERMRRERDYLVNSFDPMSRETGRHRDLAIPMGRVADLGDLKDYRFKAFVDACATTIRSEIMLGPVELINEVPWGIAHLQQ